MKLKSKNLYRIIALVALSMSTAIMWAGVDYEDDIYYNPSKDKSNKTNNSESVSVAQPSANREGQTSTYVPNVIVEYADPAIYPIEGTGLNVDVDEYNRRGQFMVMDTVVSDPVASDLSGASSYRYTQRIERFYNEDIVNGSNNQDLIDSYYTATGDPDINIYVVNASPWSNYTGWYNPWSPWSWNSLYWDSLYFGPTWGWSYYNPWYSWSWGWGPSWSWGPTWGWGPGWGGPALPPPPGRPGFGPGHGPGYGGGNVAVNPSGMSRPHAGTGNARPTQSTPRRPGAFSAGARTEYTRPAGSSGSNSRPSSSVRRYGTTNGNNSTPGNSTVSPNNRGRNNSSGSTNSRNNSVTTPSRNTNNSSGSYRNTSGGGSRTTHGTSGGGRSGGGSSGGGRGRR